jgi:hypothetical protein
MTAPARRRGQPTDYPEFHTHPLPAALDAAVPLYVERFRRLPPDELERAFADHARLMELATLIGEHGDDLLFRSKKPGASADVFNRVAEGIALLSFCPGGIDLFGRHWEATR